MTEAELPQYRTGDVVYVSLPDPDRAVAFYPDVLGWDVAVENGRQRVMDAIPHGSRTARRASVPTTRARASISVSWPDRH